ncbi:hypothetical protein RB195_025735 [Necator americanus]|uniref:HTH CENPB-type domain-containing protein n=1 Tax=Necator americanus TaxID=51031 RepID=A0ABR1ETN0_NECAM
MKRRKSYTAAFKLDAVNYRDLHGTLAAASHFEVTEAMIRKWVVDRQNLQEMPAMKRARRYKKPSVEEVEDAIYNWVVKKREENRAVTVKEIRTKAKELAEEHGHQNFKASAHWCILFMAQKKLSVRRRTSVGQPLPSDHLQKCSDFRKFVAAEALNVSPFNLGNIDEDFVKKSDHKYIVEMVKMDRTFRRFRVRKRTMRSSEGDDSDEEGSEEEEVKMGVSERSINYRVPSGNAYTVARHSDPGGCTFSGCKISSMDRCHSSGYVSAASKSPRLFCPPQLLFPVQPQVRYVSERIIEVFTANTTGRVELHQILHPNMPRHSIYQVESIDLTDEQTRHRVTARDFVDRAPFSVHGTFDGRIGITKSSCTLEKKKLVAVEIWKGEDPVVNAKINQLDNGFLAATDFQCVPATTSLFVLDLVSQNKFSLKPRIVFNGTTSSNMLDVCWLWDHPSRLLLSTTDSVRLFDIRCPNQTDQALFLDHGITHMASNKFRTHVFAGFNEEEVHIYDSRRLFGPIQRINIPIDGRNGLSSIKWNPYLPFELLLHFRGSERILRCNVQELSFDPFRRVKIDSFTTDQLFSIEQIWDGTVSPDLIDARMKTYNGTEELYQILSYGEMYDKCKEDSDTPMPLCWTTPAPGRNESDEEDGTVKLVEHPVFVGSNSSLGIRDSNESHLSPFFVPTVLRRVQSDSHLACKVPRSDMERGSSASTRVSTPLVQSNSIVELLQPDRFQTTPSSRVPNHMIGDQTSAKVTGPLCRSQDSSIDKAQAQFFAASNLTNSSLLLASVEVRSGGKTSLEDNGVGSDRGTRPEEDPSVPQSSAPKSFSCIEAATVFHHLGLDMTKTEKLRDLQERIEVVMNDYGNDIPYVIRTSLFDSRYSVTASKVDSGYRIKLHHKIYSFDFAPAGYSGLLCLVEQPNGRSRFVFAPFVAPDEGFAVKPEFINVLEETRMWESFDSIPKHLYETMKSRLVNGMDNIDDRKPLLSIFRGLAGQIPKRWTQWLLSAARQQQICYDMRGVGDMDDATTDPDDFSGNEKNSIGPEEYTNNPTLDVKGLPGILQLCTLESESDVTWQDCDSEHFSFIKIARSRVRRMILAPYCLPVSEDRMVSDEKFAANKDIPRQIPVIYLCLINGDSERFIEYTLLIRRKLGKPVFTENPCSFLNAFCFFGTVVFRYLNQICDAENKSSAKYDARRLRLEDKIHAFVKEHCKSPTLNPLFIPMLLFLLGVLTSTHPMEYTRIVLENQRIPLSLRIAWCVNLLPTIKMKEALHFLFEQSTGMDRLQFVGLGRHPDSLHVLSEYLYSTQDCQVVSHLLVAGRCFEGDDPSYDEKKSVENMNLTVDGDSTKEICSISYPSLYTMFPTSYFLVTDDLPDLLHLTRAEFCRYSYILQQMERYCLRRKLLNLVPQFLWPDFKTSVDIACTFCGSSYETALRNAESAVTEQIVQVRSRSTASRTTGSRSSASISGTSIGGPTISLSMSSAGPSDSETSTISAATELLPYDYNGVDGGTEAEIKRAPDSACPQCRKSYPRCSLCGLSYGTPVNDYDHPAGTFSMMFSTCLMCSHGGHAKHMISWFEKESGCPVLGCDCRCLHLENGVGGRTKQSIITPF